MVCSPQHREHLRGSARRDPIDTHPDRSTPQFRAMVLVTSSRIAKHTAHSPCLACGTRPLCPMYICGTDWHRSRRKSTECHGAYCRRSFCYRVALPARLGGDYPLYTLRIYEWPMAHKRGIVHRHHLRAIHLCQLLCHPHRSLPVDGHSTIHPSVRADKGTIHRTRHHRSINIHPSPNRPVYKQTLHT